MRALLSFYSNCNSIVLPVEFGELASFVRFVEFGIFTACLQRGPSSLVICIALLLADEFGEFATLATFVKFAIFAACERSPLVLLCELPCCNCLQINFGEFATFVRFVKFAMFTACKGDYLILL